MIASRKRGHHDNLPMKSDPVVITGVGAATPLGITADEIAASLEAGRSGVSRQMVDGCMDVCFGRVPAAIHEHADRIFAHLRDDEQEVARNDEGLLFGMYAADTALAQSGLTATDENRHRVAVAVSSSKGLLRNMIRANRLFMEHGPAGDPDGLMSRLMLTFSGDVLGCHVARRHGFRGPVLNYPSACATGATSLIGAVNLIRGGYADAAVVGSSESSGNAVTIASFLNMGALSPTTARPFHAERGGFNPGEGAGVVVVERESHARARGARILARVAGWDFRSDAYHITSVETEGIVVEHTVREALRRAGWRPADVDYINAHGTGTALNDATESVVISRVFGRPGPLVSSLKAHIGHLLGGSASAELAICLVALSRGIVPDTLHLDRPDPAFDLQLVRGGVAHRRVRRFMKFSLGFGGHIAALAVEMPEER